MTPRDLAEAMMARATADAHAMHTLAGDAAAADWIIGFHAEQAVEKALKAVLTAAQVRYERTHNLHRLLDALSDAGVTPPDWVSQITPLGPFGVAARYEDVGGTPPIDRPGVSSLVDRVLQWADEQLQPIAGS